MISSAHILSSSSLKVSHSIRTCILCDFVQKSTMSSSNKCTNCGSLDLDTDPARGDVVCTACGTVLEHSAIVSEIQFEENAHGGSSALGQFVSSDSKGGARGFGQSFHTGLGKESREITQQNARKAITNLAHQLRLSQLCIDEAFNFFKMALSRQLTRGRRSTHVIAACLYMTCRIEGTAHMLIDFSDVLQIDVYELGRTYLRLSQALSLSIPSMDPCIYIFRFANRLDFASKTHEVAMTAIRLVQRMKRDSIHTGRRPSGLCGAALLIAARLHEFNRTVDDVIKIVKVHESTLRKRLMEFGETPSSALTLDEFMNVDLEEEQDPPSFKAARKKDRERLQKLMEESDMDSHLSQLQHEIERQLDERKARSKKFSRATESLLEKSTHISSNQDGESAEADRFATQSTIGVIRDCLTKDSATGSGHQEPQVGLGPSIASMGLLEDNRTNTAVEPAEQTGEIDLQDIDDNEIDSYIMSEQEASNKDCLWMKVNADYLQELKEKEEKAKRDQEEGKPEKKKRKPSNKKGKNAPGGASGTAGEAVQKMLQEKKMSSKLNYDVLKNLSVDANSDFVPVANNLTPVTGKRERLDSESEKTEETSTEPAAKVIKTERAPRVPAQRRNKKVEPAMLAVMPDIPDAPETPAAVAPEEADVPEDYDDMDAEEPEPQHEEQSWSQLLNQHRGEDDCYGEDYDYDDY